MTVEINAITDKKTAGRVVIDAMPDLGGLVAGRNHNAEGLVKPANEIKPCGHDISGVLPATVESDFVFDIMALNAKVKAARVLEELLSQSEDHRTWLFLTQLAEGKI